MSVKMRYQSVHDVTISMVTSSHDYSRGLPTPTNGRFVGLLGFTTRRVDGSATLPLLLSRQGLGVT